MMSRRAIEPALANEENRGIQFSVTIRRDEVRLDLKATLRINQKLGQTKKGETAKNYNRHQHAGERTEVGK